MLHITDRIGGCVLFHLSSQIKKKKYHSMSLNASYKPIQGGSVVAHTCNSWYSGHRYVACLLWLVLVAASSAVQQPAQLKPLDQPGAWRPERTSSPVMATPQHTDTHLASLLRQYGLFIIIMLRTGLTWLVLHIRCKSRLVWKGSLNIL